jgi:hypothetical protein
MGLAFATSAANGRWKMSGMGKSEESNAKAQSVGFA